MKRVITFGVFDLLHPGHIHMLQSARSLGDTLIVVVARNEIVTQQKGSMPKHDEQERLEALEALAFVDMVVLGDEDPTSYETLRQNDFDILAVGYDQMTDTNEIKTILRRIHKEHVVVVRLPAYKPKEYKSSLLRDVAP